MIKIAEAFKGGKAFIPFITCGDPDLDTTGELVRSMAASGADMVELGIPFSDPTAEGPVIQEANFRALSGNVTTDRVLDFVREIRKDVSIPLVFMAYANVVFSYGSEKFITAASSAGVAGLVIPDLPYEEKEEFAPLCGENGLDLVPLIAPTSKDRIAMIAREAEGFVYIVSSLGVTGVRRDITSDIGSMVKLVRDNTAVPSAVGFGISTPEQAVKMGMLADGVIVGSAIVKMIAEHGRSSPLYVAEYVRGMKEALRKI